MNLRRTVGVFVSGALVYAVVAACSSASSSSAGTRVDGGIVGAIVQDAKAVLDAIASPTPDASAGTTDSGASGPTVSAVPCSSTYTLPGGQTWTYAEQAYPGTVVADLSAVRVVLNYPSVAGATANNAPPGGYASSGSVPWVRDGFVAVLCGATGNPNAPTSVTFVLP